MMEEWRVCPFNDNYQVSSEGRVRRATFSSNRKSKPGDIIKLAVEENGYSYVNLWRDGKTSRHAVHRLVATAFHGTPPTISHEVAHGDGVRSNNTKGNLRWATRSENHADKHLHGTQQHGDANGNSKLTINQVKEILTYPYDCNRAELARKYGVSHVTVSRILRRELWKHVDTRELV